MACKIAGLNLIRIIKGTNAFAISYSNYNIIQEEKNVLIFHLGAGFFDVSIITIVNNLFEVKSICGDNYLGGEYFDNRLLEYCINKFKEENGIDISNNKKALLRLKLSCEKAKINLSKMEITTIALDDLINEEDFYITITRSEFEELCKKDFDKLISIIEECLNNINFTKYNIDDIFLIGESTHIPKIKQIVKDYFEKEVNKTYSLESETIGATIQGAISNNLDEIFTNIVLLQVIPFSLGIELDNGEMDVILSKNTIIPHECIKSYEFEIKNKNKIIIKAYEGEKRLAKENIFLGIIEIANIVPNQGKKIRIDVNGDERKYTATGTDKDGKEFSKEIDPYNVDPTDADFTEFAALCSYIRDTENLADETMKFVDNVAADDIFERMNYLSAFSAEVGKFEFAGLSNLAAEKLMPHINRLMEVLINSGIGNIEGARINVVPTGSIISSTGIAGNHFGSWSALKSFMDPLGGQELSSVEEAATKKLNWVQAISEADVSFKRESTGEVMDVQDVLKMLIETYSKLESKNEEDDWRGMSDEEWEKILDRVDNDINAMIELIREEAEKAKEIVIP